MQIGVFRRNSARFSGTIHTLTLIHTGITLKALRSNDDNAPDFRVYANDYEADIAYWRESKKSNRYVSVLLDNPGFPKAIWCNLLISEQAVLPLIWDRSESKAQPVTS